MSTLHAEQMSFFRQNIKTKLTMECCSCNSSFIEHYDIDEVNDYGKVKKEFSMKAFEKGWRYSVSKFLIGKKKKAIRCHSCHVNRNNKKHWD
jgi:hypothetical protein